MDDLDNITDDIIKLLKPGFPIYLSGELGAGKSTLTKKIINKIFANDVYLGSPTFQITNLYESDVFGNIWHIDLYMSDKITDDYNIHDIVQNDISIIEWPENYSFNTNGISIKILFTDNDAFRDIIIIDDKKQFYGRKNGRKINSTIEKAYNNRMDIIRYRSVPTNETVFLDIGFGVGEFILHNLKHHPKTHIIGVEVFKRSIAKLVSMLSENDLNRLQIFDDNIHKIIHTFPKNSIDLISILFPDPWPKEKQKKRRLIDEKFLYECNRILKEDGKIIIATDNEDYAMQTLSIINGIFSYHNGDNSLNIEDWNGLDKNNMPITKYAQKAINKVSKIMYTVWKKNNT